MRDMQTNPYTPDEKRVANYLWQTTNGAVGGGDDPIGFILASHAALREKLVEIHEATEL